MPLMMKRAVVRFSDGHVENYDHLWMKHTDVEKLVLSFYNGHYGGIVTIPLREVVSVQVETTNQEED